MSKIHGNKLESIIAWGRKIKQDYQAMKRRGGRSRSESAIYCEIPSIQHSGKGKAADTVNTPVVAERSAGGRDDKVHRGFGEQ